MSMLMRRVPDPGSSNWSHMSLYLTPRDKNDRGIWLEDFKFLSAYKLKSTVHSISVIYILCYIYICY